MTRQLSFLSPGFHLGFTGTQRGMTEAQKAGVRLTLKMLGRQAVVHHGDCIGADSDFHNLQTWVVCSKIIIHPPQIETKRAFCHRRKFPPIPQEVRPSKPYLDRNHDIVDESHMMIATPGEFEEQLRSGTWATIRYARGKVPLRIIYPTGQIEDVQ